MGKQPDNDDIAAAKVAVSEAKKLSPKHETVSTEACPLSQSSDSNALLR